MKVTIITVCYNSAKTIEDTIRSVVSQKYPSIEYIIIDGLSKDNTLDIVNKYSGKISKIVSEKDKGIYDALNKGISLATGDIIGMLHADDLYINEFVIEKVVAKFVQEKSDALYADLVYVDVLDTNKITRVWKSGKYSPDKFKWGWMPPHPTFFVKPACYKNFGTFNLALRSAADYELMLRLIHKHKISLSYLPEVIVKMREGGLSNASVTNRVKANNEDRKAWEINDLKPYFFSLFLKPIRKIPQFFQKRI